MVKKITGYRTSDSLCCCEYVNKTGHRSHLLACCCDCEALDSVCDQFITCKAVNNSTVVEMFATIEDRLRIPSCTGKGAIKVNLDVALPIVIIPTGILLGTLHPALTILMLVFMPLSLVTSYRLWLGMKKKPRTRLFFAWGLVSVCQMYVTFEIIVVPYKEVLLWENLMLTSLYLLMLYALYCARKDPGIIRGRSGNTAPQDMMDNFTHLHNSHQTNSDQLSPNTEQQHQKQEPSTPNRQNVHSDGADDSQNQQHSNDCTIVMDNIVPSAHDEAVQQFGYMGATLLKNFGMDRSILEMNVEQRKRELKLMAYITPSELVSWVDSRMMTDGSVNTWCEECKLEKPARAGHCKVCNACIHCRDHHCVWVDMCIGGYNHRSFIAAVALFIIGGIYGTHLSMTTVCTPQMYFGWFLLPTDCRYMYADFPTALVFVSSLYSMIAVFGMILVLLSQAVLISTNTTSEEMYKASMRGWTKRCGFCATNNGLDKSCLKNWWNFLRGARSREQSYDRSMNVCQSGCACEH